MFVLLLVSKTQRRLDIAQGVLKIPFLQISRFFPDYQYFPNFNHRNIKIEHQ